MRAEECVRRGEIVLRNRTWGQGDGPGPGERGCRPEEACYLATCVSDVLFGVGTSRSSLWTQSGYVAPYATLRPSSPVGYVNAARVLPCIAPCQPKEGREHALPALNPAVTLSNP